MSAQSTFAYAIKAPRNAPNQMIDPRFRDSSTPLYLARAGVRYQYSDILNADLFATKSEANALRERGETIQKVRVVIVEVEK